MSDEELELAKALRAAYWGGNIKMAGTWDSVPEVHSAWMQVAAYARQHIAPRVAACTREDAAKAAREATAGLGSCWEGQADAIAKAAGFAWREEKPAEHRCMCCGAKVGTCEHTRASTTFSVGSVRLDTFKAEPPKPAEEWPVACSFGTPMGIGWNIFTSRKVCWNWNSINNGWTQVGDESDDGGFVAPSQAKESQKLTVAQWRSLPAAIDRQAPGIKRHEPLPRVVKTSCRDLAIVTGHVPAGPLGVYWLNGEWHDCRVQAADDHSHYAFHIGAELVPGELMSADDAADLRRDFPELALHHNIAPDLPPPPKIVAWKNAEEAWADGLRPGVEIKFPGGEPWQVKSVALMLVEDHQMNQRSFEWLAETGAVFADSGKPCGREVQ